MINHVTQRKINDDKYDKNKQLLHELYGIQASKWVKDVMDHLEMNQSSLYDTVIEACSATVNEDIAETEDKPLIEEVE